MNASQRRNQIIKELSAVTAPVSASHLAQQYQVSRQIIVGDIALLRAAGNDIIATPRGYLMNRSGQESGIIHTVAVSHKPEEMQEEMNIMVDNGCFIENVIVEHPVYGQLVGQLHCASRHDVQSFIDKVNHYKAAPLSQLIDGLHLHTLRCPDEASFQRVREELRQHGFLYEASSL